MTKTYIKKWLVFKGGSAFLAAFSVYYIYQVCSFAQELHLESLIIQADIIGYNGKVIICMAAIPAFMWVFFFSLKNMFRKGIDPIKKYTTIGYIWLVVSVVSFILGSIASFIIPFILMVSPYTSCDVGTRDSYYAIRPELCKTIVINHGVKKRKNTGGISKN